METVKNEYLDVVSELDRTFGKKQVILNLTSLIFNDDRLKECSEHEKHQLVINIIREAWN